MLQITKTACRLLTAFTTLLQISFAQIDSNKIYNSTQLKRGFYKSYEEFINNSPSGTTAFNTVLLTRSKSDSTVIGAEYKLVDSLQHMKDVWGFCDGESVFVEFSRAAFNKKFWKLEQLGPYSFFTYKFKSVPGPTPIGLITLTAPARFLPMIITEKGKFQEPTIQLMRKILKSQPALHKSFRELTDKYDESDPDKYESEETYQEKVRIMKDFILQLNETIKNR